MPAANWPFGDTTTTTSDRTHHLETKHPLKRRALEQFEGSTYDALAQTDDEKYEIQTRKLSL
jgi:hypothetical protein